MIPGLVCFLQQPTEASYRTFTHLKLLRRNFCVRVFLCANPVKSGFHRPLQLQKRKKENETEVEINIIASVCKTHSFQPEKKSLFPFMTPSCHISQVLTAPFSSSLLPVVGSGRLLYPLGKVHYSQIENVCGW